MRIIVFIKPVPDFDKIKVSRGQGKIFETGKMVLNSYDRVGLQVAMNLKKIRQGYVSVISICDMTKTDILREAYAVGSDRCYNIWEDSFEENDAYINAKLLGEAINKITDFDLIICGAKSDTGFSGQTGPRVAEYLKIPQMTSITEIQLLEGKLKLVTTSGYEKLVAFPMLITVDVSAATPQIPNALNIMKAFKKEIIQWKTTDLNLNHDEISEQSALVTLRSKFLTEV